MPSRATTSPPKDTREIRIATNVDDETNEKLRLVAFKERTSKAAIMRKAIDQYLSNADVNSDVAA